MLKNNIKNSIVFNFLITILVLISTFFIIIDFKFMGDDVLIDRSSVIEPFKYFTVESNILMGVIAFIFLKYEISFYKGKIKEIPKVLYILKHVATVSVALTFFTTTLFLAPFSGYNFFLFFTNSGLFFHLIVPILSMITYIFFEKTKQKNIVILVGMIPMFLYSIFYIINYLLNNHLDDFTKYDWYGFIGDGGIKAVMSISVMYFVTFIISLLLYRLNKNLVGHRSY